MHIVYNMHINTIIKIVIPITTTTSTTITTTILAAAAAVPTYILGDIELPWKHRLQREPGLLLVPAVRLEVAQLVEHKLEA